MSPEHRKLVVRRILVPIDESRHSRAALQAAVLLAAILKAELRGLYVEDKDLLELAKYPFFREVRTYECRHLGTADLERDLRLQAERIRQMVASMAQHADVTWTFVVRRGGVRPVIAEQTAEADLTVIGRLGRNPLRSMIGSTVRHLISHGTGMTLILREDFRLIPPVIAVYTGSGLSAKVLDAAVNLARAGGGLLEVLIPARSRDSFQEIKREVDAMTADATDLSIICHPVRTPALPGLMSVLQSEYRQPLVIPGDITGGKTDDLLLLISRINNPVLLVR